MRLLGRLLRDCRRAEPDVRGVRDLRRLSVDDITVHFNGEHFVSVPRRQLPDVVSAWRQLVHDVHWGHVGGRGPAGCLRAVPR